MTAKLMNILKLRELRILYDEDATSMILEIELQSTSLSVNYVEETRFRKIKNIMR